MTSPASPASASDLVIEVVDVSAGLTVEIAAALGAEQLALWQVPRGYYRPEVWLARDGDQILSGALTSGRPHTAYRKVVDVWALNGIDGIAGLLQAIVTDAEARDLVAVKLELHSRLQRLAPELTAVLGELGFTRLAAPLPSSSGTLSAVDGFVRWIPAWPHTEQPYYGQTTDFTCGAVAGLTALERAGIPGLSHADRENGRVIELALWRQATNFPACEPLGLAVAATERLRENGIDLLPEVHLSTEDPILLELGAAEAADLRALLQRESLERALQLGIPVHRDWLSVDDIAAHVTAGDGVLLLIDERYMHDDQTPHWVFAHAIRDNHVLVQDPWIDVDGGETWVDAHELPLAKRDIDTMARYGDPDSEYRGVIVVPAFQPN